MVDEPLGIKGATIPHRGAVELRPVWGPLHGAARGDD